MKNLQNTSPRNIPHGKNYVTYAKQHYISILAQDVRQKLVGLYVSTNIKPFIHVLE